ncbi:penicillin-binding protein 1C [Dysgonomonas sp. PFB1-18]|uniref:penicillin-binding protein 1C n=2 Tax=unclassified Dysgonomonas TaxID=2630389 RepID=UPI002476E6FF|nr:MULTISPECIES: penicillin-binding protein 1C [unclassified Dysgonomonas]MDH6307330.1 penicillin-binding protein 1C [Dysgonomonas sp. PF1-14]MDH6337248.1 penicillin-binding protein 1C [Dysgonomonas sp. PF1-16]MDH6379172.1 penicillin-binding protein 1C [Dysgonomonas sp. PFB1-18]MDH6396190.1 penicillin-binding protein 1C [Dysgonomonas sp. PF1-23]
MLRQYMEKIKAFLSFLWEKYRKSKKRYRISIPICLILLVWYIFCLPSPLFHVPYSTVVSDRHNELLGARIATDQQWRFPTPDSIPDKYKTCLIEFEDKHFHRHWGVNPLAIGRAIKQNIDGGKIVSGASTITMQAIRLSRNERRTFGEKFIEMILATRMEFSYSKDEILALYAAHAPMGGNVVGIEAASWRYFGHRAATLSWAEAATLAVLPNSPSLMHFGRNRDKLLNKRNKLLRKLYQRNILDEVDYELAISEPLPFQPQALPQIAPHLVARLYRQKAGEYIVSTIDRQQQERTENILARWNAEFAQNGIKNIAAIIFDVEKNEVVAYCGNVDFERDISANQVDIIQAPRSTGSILKPFLYCAMLQEGLLLPDQLLPDVPINLNGFAPKNFSLQYDGAVHASDALARSLNVPSVVSLRKYSVPKFYNVLQRAGMTTLNRSADNYGLSLILGGAEGKLWDISYMYLQMAQQLKLFNEEGRYFEMKQPSYLLADNNNEKGDRNRNPLFSAGAIWQTLEALTNVNRPEEIDWRSIPSIQKIAWKTGTSFGFRDGWSVGVSPKYVVGVWVGNSDGEGRPGLTGARTAGMVMFDIFNSLPQSRWFERPESDLVIAEICHESGFLKGMNCPETATDTTWISKKGRDAAVCPYHKLVHLSEDMKYQVFNDCAGSRGIVHTPWFILPPSWEWYYKEQHPDYRPLPPYSPECREDSDIRLMEFIYPFPNAIINLPKQLDGSPGKLVFEVAHRNPQNRIFWHLDGQYIGDTQYFHKKEYSPSKGEHSLTVVDETGVSMAIKFSVK